MKTYPVLLAVLLAGCNVQPLEYSKTGDIKSGPGMFSGASGGFGATIGSQPAAPQPAEQSTPPAAQSTTPAAQSAKPVTPPMSEEEYREFQDWREWKRQREAAGKN